MLCRLLASVYLQEDYFDLVDVDSFGSDTSYLPAAIDALKYGGMLYLTSTDGISAGGEPRWQFITNLVSYRATRSLKSIIIIGRRHPSKA
jgi:tRNA (guanine26-N2/guanine27-N2)-dimethyltransferase